MPVGRRRKNNGLDAPDAILSMPVHRSLSLPLSLPISRLKLKTGIPFVSHLWLNFSWDQIFESDPGKETLYG